MKSRFRMVLCALLIAALTLGSLFPLRGYGVAPDASERDPDLVRKLREAKARLDGHLTDLRGKGLQIEEVLVNETVMAVQVNFKDLRPKHVTVVREVVGYDVPVLIVETELDRVEVGQAPTPPDKLWVAINLTATYASQLGITGGRIDAERGVLYLRVRELNETVWRR